jgi:hypothetical protein
MKSNKYVVEEIEEGLEMHDSRYDDYEYWDGDHWDDDANYHNREYGRYASDMYDESRYSYVDENEEDVFNPILKHYKKNCRNCYPPKSLSRQIDMNSIYDRQTFRKKQIERVLGIDKTIVPTLGDLYEYSKGT